MLNWHWRTGSANATLGPLKTAGVHPWVVLLLSALALVAPVFARAADGSIRAAVWMADVPGADPALARALAARVAAAGYTVDGLDSLALTNAAHLDPKTFALLAVPDARRLPVESVKSITAFLEAGGDLLALGLTAWESPAFRLGNRWLSRVDYERELAQAQPRNALIDFSRESPAAWIRHSSHPARAATREIVRDQGHAALHVTLESLDSWDTLESPARSWSIPAGHALTCFQARGGPATLQLALEWVERDGSRWIATVDLTTSWQTYALPPERFRPWEPPAGRGGPGDRLDLGRAARFTVGLAHSHTAIKSGRLEYWLADLATAANPFGDAAPPSQPVLPRLESLAPGYQCYPIETPVVLESETASETTPRKLWTRLTALHPRPRGVGLHQDRPWRWDPLLRAADPAAAAAERGSVAAMIVHVKPPFRGGVWALFAPSDPDFYRDPVVTGALDRALARMREGVFLVEGGSEFFTLFPGQSARLGAHAVNFGAQPRGALRVRVEASPLAPPVPEANAGPVWHHETWVDLAPGQDQRIERGWTPETPMRIRVTADDRGRLLDHIEHDLQAWEPPSPPRYIEVRDGRFWRDNRPWRAHGVNYMPSSGIGVTSSHFEFWLGRGAYDPEVIERDLGRIRDLGLNAVSVFIYHRDLGAQHLLDFLRRCRDHDLAVNLSLRPGTPMDFRWAEMKALIEHYRLASSDVVFAYDLAWEPSHYDHHFQRQQYAKPWTDWVLARYGSRAAAERAWGPCPYQETEVRQPADALLPVPPMALLVKDGPWRRRIADYRRFLDDHVGRAYAEARRLVRSIDPHHPVSFRMQHAGDPTFDLEHMLPYDLYGLRNAVDLWEPEAYGRIGDWAKVRPGQFTAAYARLCDPAKPVLWAEMGTTVWDLNTMAPSPARLDFAARFYADFYRMLIDSAADGVFFWWYPGGFRANEKSDFGILNPDGTDRPVSRIIRTHGPRFLAAPPPAPVTRWIAVDRDANARGLPGIYDAVQLEYWKAIDAGESVGLRWDQNFTASPQVP